MIELILLDKHGEELHIGDGVKVICRSFGQYTIFYCNVQIIKGWLVPHDTFAWDSMEKFDLSKMPANVIQRKHDACKAHEDYDYWVQPGKEEHEDSDMHLDYVVRLDAIHTKSFKLKEV